MSDNVALVTGATGGIGGAIVERLLADPAGYQVLACGRDQTKLQHLLDTASLGSLVPLCFDVTSVEAWAQHVPMVLAQYEPVTLLVVAHGCEPVVKATLDLLPGEVERVWRTDVLGTVLACQTVGAAMLQQRRGSIVIVSSLHSTVTYPERTLYSMAKSSLGGLVRSLALEWGPSGVTINAVCPWQVSGARTERFIADAAACGEDVREAYLGRTPTRKLIEPSEVADAVLFLARNRGCNGLELALDGGVSKSMWFKPYAEVP